MLDWPEILKMREGPGLEQIPDPKHLVAKGIRNYNEYYDILQIGTSIFATANRRYRANEGISGPVCRFYWANCLDSLLSAAFGLSYFSPPNLTPPPDILLPKPRRFTYAELIADDNLDKYRSTYLLRSEEPTTTGYIGVVLNFGPLNYHFRCLPEESPELKDWSNEPAAVISFNPFFREEQLLIKLLRKSTCLPSGHLDS